MCRHRVDSPRVRDFSWRQKKSEANWPSRLAATARGRHPCRSQGGSAPALTHVLNYPAAFENSCELNSRYSPLPLPHDPTRRGFQGSCSALVLFLRGFKGFCLALTTFCADPLGHLPSCPSAHGRRDYQVRLLRGLASSSSIPRRYIGCRPRAMAGRYSRLALS